VCVAKEREREREREKGGGRGKGSERESIDMDSTENEKANRWMSSKELLLFPRVLSIPLPLWTRFYAFPHSYCKVNENAKERKGSVFLEGNVLSFSLILHQKMKKHGGSFQI